MSNNENLKNGLNEQLVVNYIDDFAKGVKLEIENSSNDEKQKQEETSLLDNFISDFKSKMDANNTNEIQRFTFEFITFFIEKTHNKESVKEQTYGQKAVGITFNPSNDDAIYTCKKRYADLIDEMNDLRANTDSQEQKRLCSVAITELQTAQMWSVKALTCKD